MADDPEDRSNNRDAIKLIRQRLRDKFSWARDRGATYGTVYDTLTAQILLEFKQRAGLPISDEELESGLAIADYRTRVRLGSYPPPPPPRHAILTFRGTGGIVGLDYTSRVAQMCGDVVEEVPILYPAAMGGLPPGERGAPSGNECVDIAVEMACDWIESTDRTFILCGYSLGAIAASKVRAMLLPGGRLAEHADRYVCGVMFGNPSRAFGHTFYLGAIPGGEGISTWRLPQEACTWDWLEAVDPGDMYANIPLGDIGDVIRAVYSLVMDLEVSDPLGTLRKMIPHLIRLLGEAGVELPFNVPGMAINALAGLLASFLPNLPLSGGETGAAVQAAIIALRFFLDRPATRAHISYEHLHAIPGVTYLDLASRHVRDWSARKTVKAA